MTLHEPSIERLWFQRPSRAAWVAVGVLISLLVPLGGSLFCRGWLPSLHYLCLPVHSVMETVGGLMAIGIAGILICERTRRNDADQFVWMAAGLIGMGVLDLYHATVLPGDRFVWLHSAATFVGGALFAMVWLPHRAATGRLASCLPWVVAATTVALGTAWCWPSGNVPGMVSPDGQFTPLARGLNFGGGLGFFLAGAFFHLRFCQQGYSTDWLFATHTTLLGTAAILFERSALWNAEWWWWHGLRLLAYLAALTFAVRVYLDTEQAVVSLNRKLKELNRSLDYTVTVRTVELEASQERFALAVRGSTDGLWDWDVRTDEVYYAPRFKELLGYRDDEFENVFATFETHLHADDRTYTLAAVHRHLKDGEPYDVEYRLRTKCGDYRWFRARGQAVWTSGRPVRMAGSITDITERKRAEASLEQYAARMEGTNATLRKAEAEARKAVVDRDRFLAMLSHELRNPLAAMLNGLSILEHPTADPQIASQARHAIRRQVHHMSRMLDDLLDVARVTQGKINCRKTVVDLNAVIAEAVQAVRSAIEARHQQLTVVCPPEPVLVEGDATRLVQVVENLLTNASKYSSNGDEISLTLIHEAQECMLCVEDQGCGIDTDTLNQIFELFFQSNKGLDRSDGGIGVGLTLVRRLVEMHGGSVTAHSGGPGRGSRFVIRLPLSAKSPAPPAVTATNSPPACQRIVLVEDNPDSREMLQAFLKLKGFQVEVASDGQQGLDAIIAERPDIALVDIGLPRLDGYELARQVRQRFSQAEVHLIALTGYAQTSDRETAFRAGFDEHLSKPIHPDELARVLATSRKPR